MNHLGDTNKMVSDTPRTQAVWELFATGTTLPHDVEFSTLARQLERELNEANDRIKRLEEAGDNLESKKIATIEDRKAWTKAKEAKLSVNPIQSLGENLMKAGIGFITEDKP